MINSIPRMVVNRYSSFLIASLLAELTIIRLILQLSFGFLNGDKIKKLFQVFDSSKSDQIRKVIGDETIEQKWIWLEEE